MLPFRMFARYHLDSSHGLPPEGGPARQNGLPRSSKAFQSFNSFASSDFRTLLHNGRLQPISFQSFADSFHCDGGVYPLFTSRSSAESALCESTRCGGRTFLPRAKAKDARQLLCFPHACPERIRGARFSWGEGGYLVLSMLESAAMPVFQCERVENIIQSHGNRP
jgi:hypothetical protein